jgi:hypothetical protein
MKKQIPTPDVEGYLCRRNTQRRSSIFRQHVFESLIYSIERLSFPKVFHQGDESDVMHFVWSGEFECFKEDTGAAVATAARNSGVGELGVYFTLLGFFRPRKISIRRPRQRKQGCLKVEEWRALQWLLWRKTKTAVRSNKFRRIGPIHLFWSLLNWGSQHVFDVVMGRWWAMDSFNITAS